MDLSDIREKVKTNTPRPLGVKRNYSILIPLIMVNDDIHLLYELRAAHLAKQPGEISFPGGRVEVGEGYREAAVRETVEELNIEDDKIEVIGQLDYMVTPYNITIYSYAGFLPEIKIGDIAPNSAEVDKVFSVPLQFFQNNEPDAYYMTLKHQITDDFPYHLIENGRDYKWRKGKYPVYFYQFQDYTIWGFTARLTRNFISIIA